jgi:hypothetical protein
MFRIRTILVLTLLAILIHFITGMICALNESWAWVAFDLGFMLPWTHLFLKTCDEVKESVKVAK